jgi:hypothetical protein
MRPGDVIKDACACATRVPMCFQANFIPSPGAIIQLIKKVLRKISVEQTTRWGSAINGLGPGVTTAAAERTERGSPRRWANNQLLFWRNIVRHPDNSSFLPRGY